MFNADVGFLILYCTWGVYKENIEDNDQLMQIAGVPYSLLYRGTVVVKLKNMSTKIDWNSTWVHVIIEPDVPHNLYPFKS
jgi:hypothetical protein